MTTIEKLERAKAAFEAAMAGGYGIQNLPVDSSMAGPDPVPEDDNYESLLLESGAALLKLARAAKSMDDSFRAGVAWPKFLAELESALQPLFREVPS